MRRLLSESVPLDRRLLSVRDSGGDWEYVEPFDSRTPYLVCRRCLIRAVATEEAPLCLCTLAAEQEREWREHFGPLCDLWPDLV